MVSRGGYCCWIDGRRELLAKWQEDAPKGPTYREALGEFKKLLEQDANKGTDDYLVSSLLNQYRAHMQRAE